MGALMDDELRAGGLAGNGPATDSPANGGLTGGSLTEDNPVAEGGDRLILVDVLDRPWGVAGKEETHRRGLLHRAFSVFVTDKEGRRLLLQRRAFGKYHSGGLWANTCCSHPRPGENTKEAAGRRLIEEVGIQCRLEEFDAFVYRQVFPDGLSEYEFDHVFIGAWDERTGSLRPDAAEIEGLAWVDIEALAKELQNHPERYAAWFLIAAPKVIAHLLARQKPS
jgi:isopentenyl-diphosphate delta-isomerase